MVFAVLRKCEATDMCPEEAAIESFIRRSESL